jgi:hypothetical protein
MWIRAFTIVVGILAIGLGVAAAQQSAPSKPTSGETAKTTANPPAIAPKQTPGPSAAAIPQEVELMILLRSTLLSVNHANLTGNYTVLRDLGTPDFQRQNSADRLLANFQSIRNIDIGAVAVLSANLVREPSIDAKGRLRLTGFFPSKPEQVNFDLAFEMIDRRWRLSSMALNIQKSESPAASTQSPTKPETPPATVVEPKAAKEPAAAATKPPENNAPSDKKTSTKPVSAPDASPEKKTSTKPVSTPNASPDLRDEVDRLETGTVPDPKPKPKPKQKPKESQNPFSPY